MHRNSDYYKPINQINSVYVVIYTASAYAKTTHNNMISKRKKTSKDLELNIQSYPHPTL